MPEEFNESLRIFCLLPLPNEDPKLFCFLRSQLIFVILDCYWLSAYITESFLFGSRKKCILGHLRHYYRTRPLRQNFLRCFLVAHYNIYLFIVGTIPMFVMALGFCLTDIWLACALTWDSLVPDRNRVQTHTRQTHLDRQPRQLWGQILCGPFLVSKRLWTSCLTFKFCLSTNEHPLSQSNWECN